MRESDYELIKELFYKYRPFRCERIDTDEEIKCDFCGQLVYSCVAAYSQHIKIPVGLFACFENGCASLFIGKEQATQCLLSSTFL